MPSQAETIEISDPSALPPNPLVSVYMLTYQHERFIADAIEGVIAQRCAFPIELVIGEDCSPDRTRDVVLDYQRRYPKLIRVLTSDQNVGPKQNAKRCRLAVRGNYIAICEGDDYWSDPTKLTRQMDEFQRRAHCSMVFHAAKMRDAASGKCSGALRWSLRSRTFSAAELILGDGGMIPTASMVVKRSVFLNQPAWSEVSPVGDYAIALKAAAAGEVSYLDRYMSVYRINVPYSWTQRHVPTLSERLKYAQGIENMLLGYERETGLPIMASVRLTISKYYSDVLVRLASSSEERAKIYDEIKHKLLGSDRLLAWLSARYDMRLPGTKTLIRKCRTLIRLCISEVRAGF